MTYGYARVSTAEQNEARQLIALAMHQAEHVVVISYHSDAASHLQRRADVSGPEVTVNHNVVEAEHPYGNGADLVMAYAEAFALAVNHSDYVAFLKFAVVLGYCAGEYPRVKSA